jgi:N6-adenosine-specific RNA methylase IME4
MKKYNIIYADPPWDIGYVKGGDTAGSIGGGVALPYPTMTDSEIANLNVQKIVADDALLFMWVIDSRIPIAAEIMKSWGFNFNSVAFIWNKTTKCKTEGKVRTILSPYTRRSCEYCFLGTRGKAKSLVKHNYVLQYLPWASETRKHSVKPPEARERIVQLCGDIPRVELFARQKTQGWHVWGNEIENDLYLLTSGAK